MEKITVLVGSVRKGGNTELLAEAFRDGAMKNHEVELLSVADYRVEPCTGCNACIKSEAHDCCRHDDMKKIYDRLADTDILVVASPVYFYGISAQLKAVVDRLHTPKRSGFPIKKLGLLLVAADTIPEVFDAVKTQYRLILDYFKLESVGQLCVGGVEAKGAIRENHALAEAFQFGASIE